ncbi:unnamed protein product [Adineta steineri]|uniref:NAD(P)(+)--arginine ADP-ribosyltransferase n=1 Tax=Adineta steineri TaxID=433720 RepID=A0A813Q359_9BILA|nr:unnamed protein product [Adineta steineri]CAF3882678.1 unnamed protein product [Adineta steineri]
MTTAAVASSTQNGGNLETFSLIWLDADVNETKENIDAQHQLRSSINYLKTFQNGVECEEYIKFVIEEERIVLIVSGRLGEEVVPRIHQRRQVSAVYVYCMDKKKHKQWAKNFTKIRGVFDKLDELVNKIISDQTKRTLTEIDQSLPISIFNANNNTDQSTMELNGQFVHSQLLIDVLLRLKVTSEDKNELIALCQKEYKSNKVQMAILREFEQDYRPDRALWWYTRESFLYKLLNKALRIQDINMLFLFRFLIRDVEEQLKQYSCLSPIHLYRGQLMSNEELEVLKNSVGEYISINSFFSTSTNRKTALSFLPHSESPNDNLKHVLFEINADSQVIGVKPFADIKSHSYFATEHEVLIMLGAIFRLVKIYRTDNQIWIIEMILCSDSNQILKPVLEHVKQEYREDNGETSLLSFGDVLFDMGKYDEAKVYIHRSLNQLSNDDENCARCYYALGNLDTKTDKLNSSLAWHHKSLEIRKRIYRSDAVELANSYNSIGVVYRKKGDFNRAAEAFAKALTIFKRALGDDDPKVATCLMSMGHVYQRTENYSEALIYFQEALAINGKHLPTYHAYLGISHSNIADSYRHLKNYDLALEHATLALNIMEKSLPSQHYQNAWAFEIIGNIYEDKKMSAEALSHYRKATTIYCNALPATHYYVIQIKQSVERIISQLK